MNGVILPHAGHETTASMIALERLHCCSIPTTWHGCDRPTIRR